MPLALKHIEDIPETIRLRLDMLKWKNKQDEAGFSEYSVDAEDGSLVAASGWRPAVGESTGYAQ